MAPNTIPAADAQSATPMSEQQLAEIRARVTGATAGPWMADGAEIYRAPWGYVVIDQWVGEMLRIEDQDASNADAQFVAHARTDVPALLAEVERLSADLAEVEMLTGQQCENGKHADWAVDSEHNHLCPWCRIAELQVALDDVSKLTSTWFHRAEAAEARVAELEAERHTTNEALSDAAVALRDANTAAGLVAEYRVPTADGRWLSVRREPNGDRWAIFTSHLIAGRRRAWVDGRWQVLPAYGENGVWDFDSVDAALAEAARLAENFQAVAS